MDPTVFGVSLYSSLVPRFFLGFILLRVFIGWPIVTRVFKFDVTNYSTCSSSSSIVCFFHGIPVTAASVYAFTKLKEIPQLTAGLQDLGNDAGEVRGGGCEEAREEQTAWE